MSDLRPDRRPSQCPDCKGRVRLKGTRWWCYQCDHEVASRPRPRPWLARSRIAPRASAERRGRTRERAFGDADRITWLHSLPCVAARCPGHVCDPWDMDAGRPHIQAMHIRARGMGSAKGRAANTVPACAVVHREAGEWGTSQRRDWEARHEMSLDERAQHYDREWRDHQRVESA